MNVKNDATSGEAGRSGDGYADPATEQELRADLEEIWQGESPATARETDFADEVDGRLGTRHSIPGPGE